MNTLSKIIIAVIISSVLLGCNYKYPTIQNKSNIVYMNDALNNWRKLKLHECSLEVQIIVIGTFEGRINTSTPMTKEEVDEMHNYLMDRCVLYNKLSV